MVAVGGSHTASLLGPTCHPRPQMRPLPTLFDEGVSDSSTPLAENEQNLTNHVCTYVCFFSDKIDIYSDFN